MSGFSSRAMEPADWDEIRFFKPEEFKAPERMGYEFMLWLDRVHAKASSLEPRLPEFVMNVSSSYRSPDYNRKVGGARNSSHTDLICDAVDIAGVYETYADDANWNKHRLKIILAAAMLGCRRIGLYENGSIHLDRTESRRPLGLWVRVNGHP